MKSASARLDRDVAVVSELAVSWRPSALRIALTSGMLMAMGGLLSCGSSSPVVVRVGDASIERATVNHWASAISLGNTVGTSVGRTHGTPRERALDFLISSYWLIGEAAARGVAVEDEAIEHHLQERVDSDPNGRSEFAEELSSTGQTLGDVKLEIKAELAAAGLRELLARQIAPSTSSEITDYYRHNRQRFHIPDVRITDLIEGIDTRAAAVALGRRIGPGDRFAAMALHEHVPRESPLESVKLGNAQLVHAIFAAVPGQVAGPTRFNNQWVLIVVRKLVPGRFKRFAEVRDEISGLLASKHRRRASTDFIRGYRRRWTARTNCRAGFIVQRCAQYRGHTKPEGNPLLSR